MISTRYPRYFLAIFSLLLFLSLEFAASRLYADPISQTKWLDQGWSKTIRSEFYSLSQGSQLMRYEWFVALDSPSGNGLLKDELVSNYGFLSQTGSKKSPANLPIGVVKDIDNRGQWIGLTCSACHTGRLTYQNQEIFIDGGSASYKAYRFFSDVEKSVMRTQNDPERFTAFALRVLKNKWSKEREHILFKEFTIFLEKFEIFSDTVQLARDWGAGRIDAFGTIFNRIGSEILGEQKNLASPDAPVSYPHLWGAHYHDYVQWNGSVANQTRWQRLGRNVGQVLGSFGQVRIDPKLISFGFSSTVRQDNLLRLERLLKLLRPPKWPEYIFGKIDLSQTEEGRRIYSERCSGCHPLIQAQGKYTYQKVARVPLDEVKTDSILIKNFNERRLLSGPLSGSTPLFSSKIEFEEPAAELLAKVVAGVIVGNLSSGRFFKDRPSRSVRSSKAPSLVNDGYKARSLEGIWATPPYLHNGSVASLYELLLPAEERAKIFPVGSGAFDPLRVGIDFNGDNSDDFFDTNVPGNSNAGHEFTNDLSESARWSLVEYLKTL